MKKLLYILSLAVCLNGCGAPDAQTLYERGRALRAEDRQQEAMNCFIEACRSRTNDMRLMGRVYSNIANMCRQAGDHTTACTAYRRSLRCFAAAGDTTAVAYAYNNLAWEYGAEGDATAACRLADSAMLYADIGAKRYEAPVAAYNERQQPDSVLYYTDLMAAAGDTSAYMHIMRARAFSALGRTDSANLYAKRVIAASDNLFHLDNAYAVLQADERSADRNEWTAWADRRNAIQIAIEQRHGDLSQAVLLYKQYTDHPWRYDRKKEWQLAGWIALGILVMAMPMLLLRRHKKTDTQAVLERECEALRQSKDLRRELCWDDYTQMSRICDTRLMHIADKLEQKGLKPREVRICIPVLIGLTYAQTAELLIRAESGIGKDKYTIAAKLGVSVKELRQYLVQTACEKK